MKNLTNLVLALTSTAVLFSCAIQRTEKISNTPEQTIEKYEEKQIPKNYFLNLENGVYKSKDFKGRDIFVFVGEGQFTTNVYNKIQIGKSLLEMQIERSSGNMAISFTNWALNKNRKKYKLQSAEELIQRTIPKRNGTYKFVTVYYGIGKNGKYNKKLLDKISLTIPTEAFLQ